jgi:hypothetical protein
MRSSVSPSRSHAFRRRFLMGRKTRDGANKPSASRAPTDVTLPLFDASSSSSSSSSKSHNKKCAVRHVFTNDILVVDDVLSPRECAAIVDSIESRNAFAPSTSRGPKFGEAWRQNGRFASESPAFANSLWKTVLERCGGNPFDFDIDDAFGFNPNIRVYRYRGVEGDHFGPHVDERVRASGGLSKFTALFYLSQPTEGGRTIFYDEHGEERCAIEPSVGRALFFRHGADLPEHEGEEVRGGVKYVLRSDVLFKI